MGLQKTVVLDTGVELTYHRVLSVNYSADPAHAMISVGQYIDKAARDAGKKPVKVKGTVLCDDGVAPVFGNAALKTKTLLQAAYGYLKTLPDWQDATDVLEA